MHGSRAIESKIYDIGRAHAGRLACADAISATHRACFFGSGLFMQGRLSSDFARSRLLFRSGRRIKFALHSIPFCRALCRRLASLIHLTASAYWLRAKVADGVYDDDVLGEMSTQHGRCTVEIVGSCDFGDESINVTVSFDDVHGCIWCCVATVATLSRLSTRRSVCGALSLQLYKIDHLEQMNQLEVLCCPNVCPLTTDLPFARGVCDIWPD